MNKGINKIQLVLYGLTIVIALVILIDFTLPGKIFTEDVTNVERNREKYYNAGGNSHISYKVITSKHQFSVSEDFAKSVENKQIVYYESLIFKQINRHKLVSSEESTIYSFRIVSGLVLPLMVITTILIAYFYKKELSILIFVLQVLLLGNFIMLVL